MNLCLRSLVLLLFELFVRQFMTKKHCIWRAHRAGSCFKVDTYCCINVRVSSCVKKLTDFLRTFLRPFFLSKTLLKFVARNWQVVYARENWQMLPHLKSPHTHIATLGSTSFPTKQTKTWRKTNKQTFRLEGNWQLLQHQRPWIDLRHCIVFYSSIILYIMV